MDKPDSGIRKRIPIRRRFLTTVLLTTVISILAVSITGFFCIRWIHTATERTLTEQLEMNLKDVVEQKVDTIDAKLEHFEKYVQLTTDTIADMYANEEQALSTGKVFYPPTDTHDYALTRAFASRDLTEEKLHDDILLFSNLEHVWEPIAKENEDFITTVYLGTESGLLVSYDKYSYLSFPPPGEELVYNYFTSEWYKKGTKEDGICYTNMYMDFQGRGLTITIASGFDDARGMPAGVVGMDFDLSALSDELFATGSENGSFAFALDQTGTIISKDSDVLDLKEATGLTLDELDQLKADSDGVMELNDSVYVCVPVERVGWTLCACVPKEAIQDSIHAVDESIRNAFLAFIAVVLLILLAAVVAVNKSVTSITYPLELLGRDIKIITDGDLSYRASVYRNDEIGDITSGMNAMVDRLNFTMNELISSQQQADAMSRLAMRDSLTDMRNKTAFDEQSRILGEEIGRGEAEFGFVMLDLNNLKLINDNFGHEKGDIAIRGFCRIISDVFAQSAVYRVGGDEFVVVLQGEDYRNVEGLVTRFKEEIRAVSGDEDLKQWERVSGAIGYALYDKDQDSGTESVLDRADREMYACKKAMKGL